MDIYLINRTGVAWKILKYSALWTGFSAHEILTDTQAKEIIARFKNVSVLQTWRNNEHRKLVIYDEDWKNDEKLLDVAVMTLIAVKQKYERRNEYGDFRSRDAAISAFQRRRSELIEQTLKFTYVVYLGGVHIIENIP